MNQAEKNPKGTTRQKTSWFKRRGEKNACRMGKRKNRDPTCANKTRIWASAFAGMMKDGRIPKKSEKG